MIKTSDSINPAVYAMAVLSFLLLMTALYPLDWSLSQQVINRESHFVWFFNLFGETPAIVGLLVAFFILNETNCHRTLAYRLLKFCVFIPALIVLTGLVFFNPIRYVFEFSTYGIPSSWLKVNLVLTLCCVCFISWLSKSFSPQRLAPYRQSAKKIVVLILLDLLIVSIAKIVWGRPRMRSIESFSQFQYWYQIMGPAQSNEFKSFPSSHTANGFVAVAFALLVPAEKPKLKLWVVLVGVFWGTSVAISRVMAGAHFLSDVVAGAYITILLYYIMDSHIKRRTE